MKIKTARKTLIFLPILAILSIVAGVFYDSKASAADGDVDVASYEELVAALNNDAIRRVYIQSDITFEEDLTFNKIVVTGADSLLNLNGHKVVLDKTFETHANTVITGNGVIESDIENPIQVFSGDMTIENGSFVSSGNHSYVFIATLAGSDSELKILGGDFDISNIIVNNYGSGKVVISGGTFKSAGDYYESDYSDAAFMTSDSGILEIDGDVTIESKYRFLGEGFVDAEEYRGEVICKKGHVSEAIDWLGEDEDWAEYDYNTITICGANETLEADETIDDSSNYKLINSNITIPSGITLTNTNAKIIVANASSFTICGNYVGSDDSLVEEGGSIVRECEENGTAEEETTPPTFDGVTYAVAFLIMSGAGFMFSLSRAKASRK